MMLDQRGHDAAENLHRYAAERAAEIDFGEVRRIDRRHRLISAVAIVVVTAFAVLTSAWLLGSGEPPVVIEPPVEEQSLSNGDFETGDLTDWKVYSFRPRSQSWGGWFVYEDALTPPVPTVRGTMMGGMGFAVLFDPPQGDYAAVSLSNQAGLNILYQDFVVDERSVLRVTVFYNQPKTSPGETGLTSPDHFRVGPDNLDSPPSGPLNQQYRIDLIDPAASIDSLADEDVLGTVFRTVDGDPLSLEPTEVIFDLSPWEGQTIRLRAVEVDTRGIFFAGIDDVRIERAD